MKNEVSHRVKGERNILHTLKGKDANWIGRIVRRNRLLKHVLEGEEEGRMEVKGRLGGRCRQLMAALNPYRTNVENRVSS